MRASTKPGLALVPPELLDLFAAQTFDVVLYGELVDAKLQGREVVGALVASPLILFETVLRYCDGQDRHFNQLDKKIWKLTLSAGDGFSLPSLVPPKEPEKPRPSIPPSGASPPALYK